MQNVCVRFVVNMFLISNYRCKCCTAAAVCWYSKHPVCSVPIRGILQMRCMSVCPCLPCPVFTHCDIDVHQYLQYLCHNYRWKYLDQMLVYYSIQSRKALVGTLNKETAPSPNVVNIDVETCQNWRAPDCIRISYLLSPSRGRMSGALRAAAAGGATEWPAPAAVTSSLWFERGRCLNLNNLYCFPQKSCR